MLSLISPSKTLNFKTRVWPRHSLPFFSSQIKTLTTHLKTLSESDLAQLMNISPKLADLNYQRYKNFCAPFTPDNSCQALLAFKGDVYQGIDVDHFDDNDFNFTQNHLRILSGLYGLLRPLDLIQPYRLEMGIRLSGPWGKNLYQFWGNCITDRVDHEVNASEGDPILINLASNEYFKAIRPKYLKADILNIGFKEKKKDGFKVIGTHAKRARGLMTNFIIHNKINRIELLKQFDQNGYRFNPALSTPRGWVFSREKPGTPA